MLTCSMRFPEVEILKLSSVFFVTFIDKKKQKYVENTYPTVILR